MSDSSPWVSARKRVLIAGSILAVVVLIGVWSATLYHQPPRIGGDPLACGESRVDGDAGSPLGYEAAEQELTSPFRLPTAEGEEPPRNDDDSDVRRLRIECRTVEGEPFPGARIKCTLLAPAGVSEYDWIPREFFGTGDENGNFLLEGTSATRARFDPVDTKWYFKYVEVTFSEYEVLTIVMQPAGEVRIRATYDDGQPVTYMGSLHSEDMISYSVTFGFSEDGTASIDGIPHSEPLKCLVFAQQRAGYDRHMVEFSPAELASGRELEIVVPRGSNRRGWIEIQFAESVPEGQFTVVLEHDNNTFSPELFPLATGTEKWKSKPLKGGTKWRVTVLGPQAWRSGWIAVDGGEITEVSAELRGAGAVRARLLDSSLQPLEYGALRINDRRVLCYSNSPLGLIPLGLPKKWWSDKDGRVQLDGLPVGVLEILAEARGKEENVQEVHIAEGEITDLGDIVLLDAVGEITIQLTNTKPGLKYVATICQTLSGDIVPSASIIDGTYTWKKLPLAKFHVGVTLEGGGSVVSKIVELSRYQLSHTVFLDASMVRQ
jgi:hypothetical protein